MNRPYGVVKYFLPSGKPRWYVAPDEFSYFAVLSDLFFTASQEEIHRLPHFVAFIL